MDQPQFTVTKEIQAGVKIRRSNLTLTLASMLLAALGAEGVLRIALARPPGWIARAPADVPGLLMPDSSSGIRYASDFEGRMVTADFDVEVVTDARGHRVDPEANPESADIVILAAGNSLTFGWGVEASEAWPEVLRSELSGRLRRPVEVVNAGVSGHSLDQTAARLEAELAQTQVDLVVLGIYANGADRLEDPYTLLGGHMVRSSMVPRLRPYGDGLIASPLERPTMAALYHWLAPRSYLGSLALTGAGAMWDALSAWGPAGRDRATSRNEGAEDPRVVQTRERVRVLRERLHERQVGLFVILMVTEHASGALLEGPTAFVSGLAPHLEQESIGLLDTVELFRRQPLPPGSLRFDADGHWNATAHSLVAAELAARLMEVLDRPAVGSSGEGRNGL